jgi:hypothetical protein
MAKLTVLSCGEKEKIMRIEKWLTASVIVFFALISAMAGVCAS